VVNQVVVETVKKNCSDDIFPRTIVVYDGL
jgi:hypothetical protein